MNMKVLLGAGSVAALLAFASPAAAWDVIGVREVKDRTEHDSINVGGNRTFNRIKICVKRNPVHFIDVDIHFENGGHQDVSVASRINPGQCTRVIDLEGGNRDISRIDFLYEETSFRRAHAQVKVLAE